MTNQSACIAGTAVARQRAGKHWVYASVGVQDGDKRAAVDSANDRLRARMAWIDEQDADFRVLVHEVGLNRACQQTGRRVPA